MSVCEPIGQIAGEIVGPSPVAGLAGAAEAVQEIAHAVEKLIGVAAGEQLLRVNDVGVPLGPRALRVARVPRVLSDEGGDVVERHGQVPGPAGHPAADEGQVLRGIAGARPLEVDESWNAVGAEDDVGDDDVTVDERVDGARPRMPGRVG